MATKDTNTKSAKPKIMDKPKPGPNNPDKAGQFVTDLNTALDLFQNCIHSYNPFDVENTYPDFISTYHKLLSGVEDYYSHADKETVLTTIKDVQCKLIQVDTAKDQEACKKCPDPHTSKDNIITGDAMVNKLSDLPNFSSIKAHHKTKLCNLFETLQRAHNEAALVAGHVATLGRLLDPEQFTYLLKHSL